MQSPSGGHRRRRSSRAVALVLVALAAFALVGTVAQARTESDTEVSDEAMVTTGNQIWGAECAVCHGADGAGIEGQGPDIRNRASPALVDFVVRTGRMPMPAPDAPVIRRAPALNEAQREALVAFIREAEWTPKEPEIPEVDPEGGNLAHGREVYETNCIACHSPFGRGIAVSQNDIAPALNAAEPIEIAEAIRVGPGVMPLFSDRTLTEEDVDSVITYIEFLRERPNPGGLTAGRSGPVTEGIIAWVVGIGGLLVVAYFFGERREH